MIKTFYAIVTEFDCDPEKNPPANEDGARGPILYECYLNDDHTTEDGVRALADRLGFKANGWLRIATVTVDIPE